MLKQITFKQNSIKNNRNAEVMYTPMKTPVLLYKSGVHVGLIYMGLLSWC